MAADPNIYFDSSFGGVDMLVASIETTHGRDVAIQSPSRGSKHVLQDRGNKMREATIDIRFVDQPGLDPYTLRYSQFRKLIDAGGAQLFSHPLDGSYMARASDLRVSAQSDSGEIRCTVTLLAEDEPTTTFPTGAGAAPAAGVDAVSTTATTADSALGAIGETSSVPNSCAATVTGWSSAEDLDTQQVFLDVASLTQQISDAIDAFELASDLGRWPAYQAMINLQFQVVRAGEAFTASDSQLFEITVAAPMPLRAICAEIYGGALATDRADKVAKLNRVRTPGRVPPGTILKMPPRTA